MTAERAPSERLLIVDDSRTIQVVTKRNLAKLGYESDVAGTLAEGLLRARMDEPAAILLDVNLPDGSGLDIIKDLIELPQRPVIVVMTAFGSERVAVRAMRSGAVDYLPKPVELADLERAVAGALDNRRQEERARRAASDAMRDMVAAGALQRRLEQRHLPKVEGWQIAARIDPARTLGGDCFGVVRNDEVLHLWVADISGKGTGAALLAASARAVMRNHAHALRDPADIVRMVAEATHDDLSALDAFVTVFFAALDVETGVGSYVDAGHGHAMLRTSRGDWSLLNRGHDLPLGLMPSQDFQAHALRLGPGDVLAAYSDGVVEIDSPPDVRQGQAKLRSWVDDLVGEAVDRAVEGVLARVQEYPQDDDRALLMARRAE